MNLLSNRVIEIIHDVAPGARVVIWGSGQVGDRILKTLRKARPDSNFVGYVDAGVQHYLNKNGVDLYPVGQLNELHPDVIIVASIAYQEEIREDIANHFPQYLECARYLTGISTVLARVDQLRHEGKLEALEQLAFSYPEEPAVWEALASLTGDETAAVVYRHCARTLK